MVMNTHLALCWNITPQATANTGHIFTGDHKSQWFDGSNGTLPVTKASNPIISVRLADDRNSTDTELEQLSKYSTLVELRELILDETYVTEQGFKLLSRFENLQSVSMVRTDVEDGWLESLSGVGRLIELDLTITAISDIDVSRMNRWSNFYETLSIRN